MAEGGAASFTDPVGDHMTPAPQTCIENDTVESVMEVMTRGRFRHVPVLDDRLSLCGMISIGDVVKTRIAETVSEAAALRDYISAAV
jgi:CBS domain-containing protein